MKYTIDNPKLVKDFLNPTYNFTGSLKDKEGNIACYENGRLHRTDGPAIIWANGEKRWLIHGNYHRTDGPAIIWSNGDKEWYINGKQHREDGPACEYAYGVKQWYYNGRCYGFNNDFTIESWIKKCALEMFK